jgi:choice-of-anchor B domain-containing protein
MPLSSIGGGQANDIWGWNDRNRGDEYAIVGLTNGTSFVKITDPENPVYLGRLPGNSSVWRDIKVYRNVAFIVSEAPGSGMQIFDLRQLRNVVGPPVTFAASAHYSGFDNAHNVVINRESGFAYVVGSDTCGGGLHMVDIFDPAHPQNAGCYSGDGYTHDAQCVNYRGPDPDHQGKEICFNSNEDTLTIVDVTNKSAPVMLSRTGYPGVGYTHQGWLWPNHQFFFMGDELDELQSAHNTRTRYWNVWDLDAPVLLNQHTYDASNPSIDHNGYIHRGHLFLASYRAGLRILKAPSTEVAFFDIYPSDDATAFNGAWSNFPFFRSGVVIVSGIEQGLFILNPTNLP